MVVRALQVKGVEGELNTCRSVVKWSTITYISKWINKICHHWVNGKLPFNERLTNKAAASNWHNCTLKVDVCGEASCGLPWAKLSKLQSPRDSLFGVIQKAAQRQGSGGGTLWGKLNVTAACVTPRSPANLCRGRSRLPRCSSGCGGKSLGIQVTGWCQSYRGCNLRTALLDETQPFGDEKKNERGKEPKINNAASEHGKICLLVSDAVKYWDIGGVVKNQYKTFSINPFIDEGKWKQQHLKAS